MFSPPSPKTQCHVVGEPDEVSVNWTARGAVPDTGDAVKEATIGVAVVAVVVGVVVTTVVAVVVGAVVATVVVVVVGAVVGTVVAVVAGVVVTTVVAVVVGAVVTTVVAVMVGVGVTVVLPSAATGMITRAMHATTKQPVTAIRRVFTRHHPHIHSSAFVR